MQAREPGVWSSPKGKINLRETVRFPDSWDKWITKSIQSCTCETYVYPRNPSFEGHGPQNQSILLSGSRNVALAMSWSLSNSIDLYAFHFFKTGKLTITFGRCSNLFLWSKTNKISPSPEKGKRPRCHPPSLCPQAPQAPQPELSQQEPPVRPLSVVALDARTWEVGRFMLFGIEFFCKKNISWSCLMMEVGIRCI